MARSYASEYASRNALAQEQGFANYSEKRAAMEYANTSEMFRNQFPDGVNARNAEELNASRVFWEAFHEQHKYPNPKEVGGPVYEWFVEIAEDFTDDEWREKYGGG